MLLSGLALFVGYAVLSAVVGAAVAVLVMLFLAWFPIRFDWHNNSPSTFKTPNGELGIKHFIGFSRRRRPEGWFVGAIYLTGRPPAKARVVTPKPAP